MDDRDRLCKDFLMNGLLFPTFDKNLYINGCRNARATIEHRCESGWRTQPGPADLVTFKKHYSASKCMP